MARKQSSMSLFVYSSVKNTLRLPDFMACTASSRLIRVLPGPGARRAAPESPGDQPRKQLFGGRGCGRFGCSRLQPAKPSCRAMRSSASCSGMFSRAGQKFGLALQMIKGRRQLHLENLLLRAMIAALLMPACSNSWFDGEWSRMNDAFPMEEEAWTAPESDHSRSGRELAGSSRAGKARGNPPTRRGA